MKQITFLTLIIGLFISAHFNPFNEQLDKINEQLIKYTSNYPQEKIYIHTDKPYYTVNETIWFKVYTANARTHLPFSMGNIVYVDLVQPDGEVAFTIPVKIDRATGNGDFFIDSAMAPGTYVLRGYTEYMRNYDDAFMFHKAIEINRLSETPLAATPATPENATTTSNQVPQFEIQFFPEGGDLVNSLTSRVAFKAVDETGKGIPVNGKILDKDGNFIVAFKSYKFGLGFFSLSPQTGQSYQAEVVYNGITKMFDLPAALNQGYTLQVQQKSNGNLSIGIESNAPEGVKDCILHGHIRGIPFLGLIGPADQNKYQYEIPTDSLLEGVAQITLFKSDGEPMCERLVFIQNPSQKVDLDIAKNKSAYGLRDFAELQFQLNQNGTPINRIANLSLTVTDMDLVNHNPESTNIKSYLLLQSDLKGKIENPGFYFKDNKRSTKLILDLLMMTQGWRRFSWQNIKAEQGPELNRIPEDGFTFSGRITKLENTKKPIKASVTLSTMTGDMTLSQFTTEEDGYFRFAGYQLKDTTQIVIQANEYKEPKNEKQAKKGKSKGTSYVSIVLDKRDFPVLNDAYLPFIQAPANNLVERYLKEKQKINKIDSNYRQWTINLDEITISARRKKDNQPFAVASNFYSNPDQRFVLDSLGLRATNFRNIYDFLKGRVPGVEVRGSFPEQYAIIRGISSIRLTNEAQVVVDGVPVSQSLANLLSMTNVDYIDVLKGSRAAIFGADSNNGVIAVYTKRGGNGRPEQPRVGIVNFDHPGFYKARSFFAPSYEVEKQEHIKPDFRTTLHWEPTIETNEEGKASISFYTCDKGGQYEVFVEGMTAEGTPVLGYTVLDVTPQ